MPKRSLKPTLIDPLDLVMRLMAIPGKSGEEGKIATEITELLRRGGCPTEWISHDRAHELTPLRGQVGNLIVRFPGTTRGPRRLLMAHMDTVPTCLGSRPRRFGDSIRSADPATGLGADDRAGVSVVLQAALRILAERPAHPPLTFLFGIQEEVGLLGARYVAMEALGRPKLAFNWDGGVAEAVIIGATGGYRMGIEVHGLASHAGVAPEKGVSAIAIAALAIANLHQDGWHGKIVRGKRSGSSNVGIISGGDATNVVTERVSLRAEARSHNPAFRAQIVRKIESAFRRAAKEVKNDVRRHGSVEFDGQLDYEAFRLSPEEPAVQAAIRAIEAAGLIPALKIASGGLDANWMTARGLPTVTLGCGQRNPHMTTEELNIRDFTHACGIAWRLATEVT